MALNWKGDAVKRNLRSAQIAGVNATMAAAILHAKANHGAGAHGLKRFETQTGELERSLKTVQKAKEVGSGVEGTWGSTGLVYAHRIELGFQGKDSAGRTVDAPAYPFLRPAAQSEYPKLAGRIRRALAKSIKLEAAGA
jgi:hypothetical protein